MQEQRIRQALVSVSVVNWFSNHCRRRRIRGCTQGARQAQNRQNAGLTSCVRRVPAVGRPAGRCMGKPCCHTRPRMRQPLLTSAPAVRNARKEYFIFVSSWVPCGLYPDKTAGTVFCCPLPIRIARWVRDVFCFLVSPALAHAGDTCGAEATRR